MVQQLDNLIKYAKIACERFDSGLAMGEHLDISPLRQAISEAETVDFTHTVEIIDLCISYIEWTRNGYKVPRLYATLDLVDCLKKFKDNL